MRRLRAAVTPAAFFIGLALISASLVEFSRWSIVSSNFSDDFEVDVESASLFFDLNWELRDHDSLWAALREWPTYAAFAGGVLGVGLVFFRRRFVGAWTLALSTLLGLAPALAWGQEYRILSWACRSSCCDYSELPPPPLVPLLSDAVNLIAVMALLIAAAWIIAQYQEGVPLRPSTWIAVGAALGMVGIALMYSEAASRLFAWEVVKELQWPRHPPVAPERPTVWIAALLGVGLIVSVSRPLYVSGLVSMSVLFIGLLMAIPSVGIIHDEGVTRGTREEGWTMESWDAKPVPTVRCENLELEAVLTITPTEVVMRGTPVGSFDAGGLEQPLWAALKEERKLNDDLHNQAGDFDYVSKQSLIIDAAAPFHVVQQAFRALARVGTSKINLLSQRSERVPIWVRPTVHRHTCAVPIELSDDGVPLADFADWAAVVRAADRPSGALRIKP